MNCQLQQSRILLNIRAFCKNIKLLKYFYCRVHVREKTKFRSANQKKTEKFFRSHASVFANKNFRTRKRHVICGGIPNGRRGTPWSKARVHVLGCRKKYLIFEQLWHVVYIWIVIVIIYKYKYLCFSPLCTRQALDGARRSWNFFISTTEVSFYEYFVLVPRNVLRNWTDRRRSTYGPRGGGGGGAGQFFCVDSPADCRVSTTTYTSIPSPDDPNRFPRFCGVKRNMARGTPGPVVDSVVFAYGSQARFSWMNTLMQINKNSNYIPISMGDGNRLHHIIYEISSCLNLYYLSAPGYLYLRSIVNVPEVQVWPAVVTY